MSVRRGLLRPLATLSLLILLLAQFLGSWPFAAHVAFAATKPKALPASQTFQQFEQLARQSAQQRQKPHWFRPHTSVPLTKKEQASLAAPHPFPPTAQPLTMQPLRQTLSTTFLSGATGTQPLDLTSSDHHLEVIIPAGALDLSHASIAGTAPSKQHPQPTSTPGVTPTATPAHTPAPTGTPTAKPSLSPTPAATVTPTVTATPSPTPSPTPGSSSGGVSGPLTLVISEQHGHFAGQVNELGQYQVQLLTAQNQLVTGVTLTQPITIIYHYQPAEMTALDLDPGRIWLSWPDLAAADRAAHRSLAQDLLPMQNNPTTHTLSAQSHVLDTGPFAVSGDPQNQSPPAPNEASVSGNSGQLSYSYPLQIAPAPDGFAPQLALSYSSGSPNSRQSVTSPAGDAGDGWSLTLGAITAEVDPAGSAGGAQTWYYISGVDGISDRLVPDPNHSNWYFTQHLSYLRIEMITSGTTNEKCFQVWDKSSTTFNFGCTNDSLQYRYDSNGLHLYRWDLDEMNAANQGSSSVVKQINISYFQDCGSNSGNCTPASQASGSDAIRDAAVEQIVYGAGPWNQSMTVSGTVDFYYWAPNAPDGSKFALAYTQQYNSQSYACSSIDMRCDDPQTEGSNNPPAVMSTLTLLSVTSYVGNDSGSGSYAAYKYTFTYQDSNSQDCTDPLSQTTISCAGEHLLMSITPHVYQGGTSHKLQPLKLDYLELNDTYYDETQTVPGGHHYTLTTTWQYLADYYDTNTGVGEHIDYQIAYNNTHGTPYDSSTGDNRYDPTFCATHKGGSLDCGTYENGTFAHPDDRAWAQQVVLDTKAFGIDSSAMSQPETTYSYVLEQTQQSSPQMCPDDGTGDTSCVGDNWIPEGGGQHDQDWADFYHGVFQGFNMVNILSPATDLTVDTYFATDGWWSSSSDPDNAFNGDLEQEDLYQGSSTSGKHLVETVNTYAGADKVPTAIPCVSSVSDPYIPCEAIVYSSTTTTYNGSTASNPPQVTTQSSYDDYNPPGSSQSSWSLNLSGYHNLLEQTITGSNAPDAPNPTITNQWTYTVTDSGYAFSHWYTYDVNKIAHSEVDDSSGHTWECQGITYDEGSGSSTPLAGWPTTASMYSSANCTPGNFTTPMITSYAGYDVYGNQVATVDAVGNANAQFYGSSGINGKNGCTLKTSPSIMSSAWSKSYYTSCTVYDTTYNALPTSTTNTFSQTASMTYDTGQDELPKAVTDVNGQATSYTYSYDSSGNRTVQVSEPGETPDNYTTQSVTHSGCASSIPSGATTPCFEIDTNSSAYPTAISRTYYDGLGRAVETRTPGPDSGYDTVQFTVYNDANHTSATSVPFEVTSGSSWVDPATATDRNGKAPGVTITFFDAASRTIAMRDPLFGTLPGIDCPPISANATSCTTYTLDSPQGSSTLYAAEKDIDPNNHLSETFVDALGRTADTQEYSGHFKQSPVPNQQVSYTYDVLGQPLSITTTDLAPQSGETTTSVTVTMQYNDLGRLTKLVDPDRGTHTYTYDGDGHLLTDTSGSRVLGYNDDLLGRLGCVQNGTATPDADGSCTNGTQPVVQNTYDTNELGTQGSTDFPTGRLTKSQSTTLYPNNGGSTTSTNLFQYDDRGRITTEQLNLTTPSSWNLSLPTYQLTQTYTDADQPQTTQTSTLNPNGQGYTFTNVYDGTLGALTGLSSTSASQSNLASISFTINGLLGAFNDVSSASIGSQLATESFSYDGDLRPSEETTTWQSGSGNTGTFFDEARGYDAASNVDTVTTTLSQPKGQSGSSSEVQNFCYDEQNQLVWAGNSGAQPPAGNGTCGSGTLSNTFTGANYNTAFVYTHLGQLWQGPLNGTGANEQYLYCNSSAPHQLSDLVPAGQNYSCANLPKPIPYALPTYDSFGNATSRTTSTGTATLSYNSLDQMVEWQLPNTNQAWDGYDAGGTRTIQHTTIGSTSATTVYAFGLEEYSYDGSGTLLSSTHYYSLAGHLLGELQVSGSSSTTNFFLTDGLGSILGVFSNTANTAALLSTQLFTPYGAQLVSNGNSIGQYTAKGFTGQYNDAVSGLDYYVSRYYDPVAGVFLSADKANGNAKGMNPYDYVGNNPETENDPTGQYFAPPGNGNGGTPSCTDNNTCNSGNSSGYNGWNGYQGWNSGGHGFSCPDPSGCNGSGSNTSTLKSLTPKQIANWCVQNVQCMYAIQRYDDAQFGAFWQNASLFLMGAFEFFEGDPDAIEQAAEEEVTSWEVLAQQFGIKLDDAVSEALASNDPAKQAEGEAGAIVQIYSKLIGFNEKFGPNAMYGEVDAESPEAIVEVKSGGLAGQIKGLIKKYNNSITNPDRKPFVVYGPGWSEKQAMTVYENLGSLDTGQAVYVATNSTQLIEIVEYLAQEGPPSF